MNENDDPRIARLAAVLDSIRAQERRIQRLARLAMEEARRNFDTFWAPLDGDGR